MKFKIEMDVHVEDEDAHLMHFAPDTIQRALAPTKIVIDRLLVTKESEQNT